MKKFHIVIGCDCDPDRKGFSRKINNKDLFWDGIEIGIRNFSRSRKIFADKTGYWPKITWFVRSDPQIKKICGKTGFCLEKFGTLWEQLKNNGDEIAWHPHLYNWDENQLKWIQKIDDNNFTLNSLEEGYKAYISNWEERPSSVHGGWCYQNNTTIKFYSDVGIISDCSAMPGHNTIGIGDFDKSDWHETSTYPYWISKSNYQSPAYNKSDSTGVLEVPTSMGQSFLASNLKYIRDQIKRGFYFPNKRLFKYQVPLITLNPILNKELIKSSIKKNIDIDNNYFLSYFHSDELLPEKNKKKIIKIIYSLENFMKNIDYIIKVLEKSNYKPYFETLSSYTNIIKDHID